MIILSTENFLILYGPSSIVLGIRLILSSLEFAAGPAFFKFSDEYWMEDALQVSMNAVGWSAPNPAVGALIVIKND